MAPSSTDSGSSNNIIIDLYWGMELYLRIGKNFDIKVFTNYWFKVMSWAVLALTYCIKQYEWESSKFYDCKYYIDAGICDKVLLVGKFVMVVMHLDGRSMQKAQVASTTKETQVHYDPKIINYN